MVARVNTFFKWLLGLGLVSGVACSSASLVTPPPPPPTEESDGSIVVPETDGAIVLPDGAVVAPLALTFVNDLTVQVMPSDSGASILDAIRTAKTSIHMEMYLLTNSAVIAALRTAKQAGRDVKVVLNKDFPQGGNANIGAYNQLVAGGVEVVYAPPAFAFTHAKTMVIDGTSGWIMTMNLTQTSPIDNREYLVRISGAAEVSELETIFQADFTNTARDIPGRLVVSPATATPVDAQKRLVALIQQAKKEVAIEGESLADTVITEALVAAKRSGKDVRVILNDREPTTGQDTAIAALRAAQIPIVKVGTPDIHAKAIVTDRNRAYIGSQNFTQTALLKNREVGVLTENLVEVTKVITTIDADFAKGTPF
jgi:cardiolipin synthase A/B